jgi:hypothetical protein
VGQFVTCWKRNSAGITSPFDEKDDFAFYLIQVNSKIEKGLFIFPKSVLIKKGIVSTKNKDGKRGFRVYPIWDKPTSKQAIKTQQWQMNYFIDLTNIDLSLAKNLLNN